MICDYQTMKKEYFKLHNESIHEGIRHPCQLCDYQAVTKKLLTTHTESIHKGVMFHCKYCPHKSRDNGSLRRHILTKHEFSGDLIQNPDEC